MDEKNKRTFLNQRVNKEYTRREMKDTKVRLLEEDLQAFKKKCADNDTSMQRVLENYIKQYIRDGE